jgi:hypothetical protein
MGGPSYSESARKKDTNLEQLTQIINNYGFGDAYEQSC